MTDVNIEEACLLNDAAGIPAPNGHKLQAVLDDISDRSGITLPPDTADRIRDAAVQDAANYENSDLPAEYAIGFVGGYLAMLRQTMMGFTSTS